MSRWSYGALHSTHVLVWLLACIGGCGFDPEYPAGIPCSERQTCPPTQTCDVDGICRRQPLPDAGEGPDASAPDASSLCSDDRDCPEESVCNADGQCVGVHCEDGVRNEDETDIDCGGERCPACGDGAMCGDGDDCASSICVELRCAVAECGDGVTNGDDVCDTGGATATCDADCTAPACNDGVFNAAAEDCDTGGNTATCDEDCTAPACNDGVFNAAAEVCDTGGNTATCDADCTAPECGDGFVNPAAQEQCDDNNSVGGDGCSATCRFEVQFVGFTSWNQQAASQSDAEQDALIDVACALAFAGSRGASMDELSSGTLPNLPNTNTSGLHVTGTCPGCVGAPHAGCLEGHARNCVNPDGTFAPPFNGNCHTNPSRGAACMVDATP
ncbi:hypothetical protein [Haliangium sp.]|uniref:hypothetical protein n=1 Tax=Haliangium sp. TaxID=2663208 RepID=UPI003D1254A2